MKKFLKNIIVILFMSVICLIICNVLKQNEVKAIEAWDGFTSLFIPEGQNVSAGDKVYVDLYADKNMWEYISVHFRSTTSGDMVGAYLIDINTNKPYFILPDSAKKGEKYELRGVSLFSKDGSIDYQTYHVTNGYYMNSGERKYFTVKSDEEKIELQHIAIKGNRKLTENDKLYFDLRLTGDVRSITVAIHKKNNVYGTALVDIKDITSNPYIDFTYVKRQISDFYGEFIVEGLVVYSSNHKVGACYGSYANDANFAERYNLNFEIINNNSNVNITNTTGNTTTGNSTAGNTTIENSTTENTTTTEEEALKGVKIDTDKVKLNEKVIVNLEIKKDIKQAMLNFEDKENKNTMIVYVKGIDTPQPYFIVPFTTEPGNYELTYVMLRDEKGNKYQYSKDSNVDSIKQYNFDTKITVEDDVTLSEDILTLDNEKITTEIIERIKKIQGNAVIEINANTNPIINQGVFEAIKGTSKIVTIKNNDTEWTFSGNDIKDAKNIDTSVSIYKSNEENGISKMIDSGVVLEFAKNGELPGKCLIRVLANKDLNEVLSDNVANVYYYNEDQGNFDKVMLHILKTEDNYYEFYINHNSKYVLTPKEIDNKYVSGSTQDISQKSSNETSSENKNEINVKLIIEIVTIVVCVIVLTLTLSGKILSNKKKSKKEEK